MNYRTSTTTSMARGAPQRQAPAKPPAARSSRAARPDERFHFHPQATNPELWRTTVPLVVRERCGRHKGLIATWTAIHWLIVLYAASGRCAFGVREIAQEAGVGRNELTGPTGYIQHLVGLGMLHIVGYETVPGVKEPRPIYYIDLAELERQSLDLVPALLRERHLSPPPRPAPDPRQRSLVGRDAPDAGTALPPHTSAIPETMPENGTVAHQRPGALPATAHRTHETGTMSLVLGQATMPATGTATPGYRRRAPQVAHREPEHQPTMPATRTVTCGLSRGDARLLASTHENGTVRPSIGPDHARNRDVERSKEEKERESEIARAQDFQQLVAATAQAVMLVLQQQGVPLSPARPPARTDQLPATPTGEPALQASVTELWRGDREHVSPRECNQLAMIASSYDRETGGFGAYWLGRAISLADLCLVERGRPLSLSYVRSMLRRWAQEGSWGSDLAGEHAAKPTKAVPHPRLRLPRVPEAERELPAAAPVTANPQHPAIAAYRAAFGRTPNQVQAQQIAQTVTDLVCWQSVLTDWQANGWQAGAVAKMLDRYSKDGSGSVPAVSEPTPSVRVIHTYPGLDLDQREHWIRKFHAATPPAEKRAVLARLQQEHPR